MTMGAKMYVHNYEVRSYFPCMMLLKKMILRCLKSY